MDDWSKKLLEQHSSVAIALKEMEQSNRFAQTVADSVLKVSLAAEYQRAALLSAELEQVAGMHAGLKQWAVYSDVNRLDQFNSVSEIRRAQEENLLQQAMYSSAAIDEARRIAELAQTYTLHASLEPFRTSVEPFASKLLHLQTLDVIKSPAYLDAFMQTSTISDIFVESIRVDRQLQEATRQFSQVAVPTFGTLYDYGQFLNAAGLSLPHWPHVRLLTIGEKRRRFRAMLNSNAEPVHVKKAKSLVHRFELTLREILVDVMTSTYGEGWAEERLPLCDCKKLLGTWRERGGEVLDHADFAHYEWIMSYPEHFEEVFEAGFDDRATMAALIKKAGNLRAALLHCHPFTQENLRDLRLIWRTIETGLLALTADYDIESWH